MTLMRFDPVKELDRLAEQTLSVGARGPHSMPMDAPRRGDEVLIDERPHGEFAGGRRDFVSVTSMRPRRYELVVDDEVADPAARLLAEET